MDLTDILFVLFFFSFFLFRHDAGRLELSLGSDDKTKRDQRFAVESEGQGK